MSANLPAATTTCPRCGAEVTRDARFCGNCGQSIDPPAPPAYASPTTPIPPTMALPTNEGGLGKLFSAYGRIGRLEYFLTILCVWGILIVGALAISSFDAPGLVFLIFLACWLVGVVITVCAGIKRLHDFDQSGWLYLLFLVPVASFVMLLLLLFKGSGAGLNSYGYADSGSVQS